MSLVAYGASDESDTSDSEDTKQPVGQDQWNGDDDNKKEDQQKEDQISDDEEYQAVSSTSSTLFSNLPLDAVPESLSTVSAVISHRDLPPPKQADTGTLEETELEDEVRQKPSELADAPKPPPKSTTRQPVKITIPSLDEIPEDDEEGSKRKPTTVSSVKSGLFSILPAPVHSSRKEINRPLIPHIIAQRPSQQKSVVQAKSVSSSNQGSGSSTKPDIASKRNTIHSALTGYDSDSDDDNDDGTSMSQNFFSLTSGGKASDAVSSTTDNSDSVKSKPNVIASSKTAKKDEDEDESAESTSSPPREEIIIHKAPEPGLTNDTPLDFGNAARFSSWSSASSSYLGGLKPSYPFHPSGASYSSDPQISSTLQSNAQYNLADPNMSQDYSVLANQGASSDDLMQVINDKEFQRIQGKRKRGMEEPINFVDANVDDYVDPSELSKHFTEETEYSSNKSKEDMPTSQQRRKKQITYLAFQAKEKEMELKNTWSQNKLTRRQTQAKYGF